jgi:hypothetical protein
MVTFLPGTDVKNTGVFSVRLHASSARSAVKVF